MKTIAPLASRVRYRDLPDKLKIKNIHKNSFNNSEVDLLLGLPDALHFIKKISPVVDYPNLFKLLTPFGWIYCGSTSQDDTDCEFLSDNDDLAQNTTDSEIYEEQNFLSYMDRLVNVLEQYVQIEKLSFDDNNQITREELDCLNLLENTYSYDKKNRRFTSDIAFKTQPVLPNNCKSVLAQFYSQEKKLLKPENQETKKLYNEHMQDGFEKGLFEICSDEEAEAALDKTRDDCYFVPHHCVARPDSESTKIRPVWNYSYGTPIQGNNRNKKSLNDFCHKGARQTKMLPEFILEFRRKKYAFLADLRRQFHGIWLSEKHQKFGYFFWRPFGSSEPVKVAKIKVCMFGRRDCPFVASFILGKLAEMVKSESTCEKIKKVCTALNSKVYCDDFLIGQDSVQDLVEWKEILEYILSYGSFQLTKFISNSQEFMKTVPEEQRSQKVIYELKDDTFEIADSEGTKALGLAWNPQTDEFIQGDYSYLKPLVETATKRALLKCFSVLCYDILGHKAPFTLIAKLIFQVSMGLKLGWDQKLPPDLQARWENWVTHIDDLALLKLPRWLPMDTDPSHEFHIFSDASDLAYASSAYLRWLDQESQEYQCRLVMARTKLKPLAANKNLTICRLELLSCVLARDIIGVIQRAFNTPPSKLHAWCDSQVAVSWIQKQDYKSLSVWVANRVGPLQETKVPWSWIDTKNNPSDLGTRTDGTPKEIMKEFTNGPAFLRQPMSDWELPRFKFDKNHPKYDLYLEEFRPEKVLQTFFVSTEDNPCTTLLDQAGEQLKGQREMAQTDGGLEQTEGQTMMTDLISKKTKRPIKLLLYKTNGLNKMLLTLAIVMRYKEALMKKVKKDDTPLTPIKTQMDRALILFVRKTQEEFFAEELFDLAQPKASGNPPRVTKSSPLRRLNVFIGQDGLLRTAGRLEGTSLPFSQKHPFILPSKSKLTYNILWWVHYQFFCHAGVNQMHAHLNTFCHILSVRQRLKWIVRHCHHCCLHNALRFEQLLSPLPPSRTNMSLGPFQQIGCDLAGPLLVRSSKQPRSPKQYKVWLVIFTDQVSRFSYVTSVDSLDAESLLKAIIKVYALYGPFQTILCDQGSNLKRADVELKEFFRKDPDKWTPTQLLPFTAGEKGINFQFAPAHSSWRSGHVEKFVHLTKMCLIKTFGKGIMLDSDLDLHLHVISGHLNDRPLSSLYSTDTGASVALTPRMLLLCKDSNGADFFDLADNALKATAAERWRQRLDIHKRFEKIFKADYLCHMRSLDKWLGKKKNLEVNEIVMVHDASPLVKRMRYPLAKIVELHRSGRDDRIRTVTVELMDGQPGNPKRGIPATPGTKRRTASGNLYKLEAYNFTNSFEDFMAKDSKKTDKI